MNIKSTESLFETGEDQNDFNAKEVLYKYLEYWKWFLLSFVFALIGASVYLNYQTPYYKIKSSILIKDEKKGMGQDAMLKELDLFSSNKIVDNEIEILKSYTLMEEVVKELKIDIGYFHRQGIRSVELYKNSPIEITAISATELAHDDEINLKILDSSKFEMEGKEYPFNQEITTPYGLIKVILIDKNSLIKDLSVKIKPLMNVVENYITELTVEPSSKMSSVLMLSIEETVKERGIDILNTLVDAYNEAALLDKNKVAANTLVFIEERLKLISTDLELVEKNVEVYKSQEGIADITTESRLFLESVKENDLQLNQAEIQLSVLNSIEDYILNAPTSEGSVPATFGLSDPTLLALVNQLTELEMEKAKTIKLMKVDNPIVIALDEQIRKVKRSIFESIQSLRKNLGLTLGKLESQNTRLEDMIKTIPGKERVLVDITRQQAIKNNLYIFLLEKREETALSYASAVSDSRTVDTARSSIKPVKPVKRNIFLLFALLGISLPFGAIYIIDLLNDKITKRKDIEKAIGVPVIGEVSLSEQQEALVINNLSRTVIAEQIRAFRTNLSFLAPGKDLRCILFTSSMSGEGKSFISLNLGASLALTNKKTVILEFDLRKPKLHSVLNLENKIGLSNFLVGQANLDEIIQPASKVENYFIITCGAIPPNPVELLLNGKLEELMTELKKRFDYVIIDAPPVGIVTDAQILAQYADATIYVLRHGYTPKDRLSFINSLTKEKKFRNLNVVFNAVKAGGRYGGAYSYGYYNQEEKPKGFWGSLFAKKT